MAEAAALTLAADIASTLQIRQPTFLSDNQMLVAFFNRSEHSNPPCWEIKPTTQKFINCCSTLHAKIFKISRKLNNTAHILASQALNTCTDHEHTSNIMCTNQNDVQACPTREALKHVSGGHFPIIAQAPSAGLWASHFSGKPASVREPA